MKALQKPFVFLLGLVVTNLALAHSTIGVFDLDRALFQTDAWKSQLQELELEFEEEQATVAELRTELEELFASIEANAPTLTETELLRFREESQFKQLRIQQIGERVQTTLRQTQNSFLDRYRDLLGEAISDVYEEGSYDFILKAESVVISGFTFDVTPNVTAKLNELIASTNQ